MISVKLVEVLLGLTLEALAFELKNVKYIVKELKTICQPVTRINNTIHFLLMCLLLWGRDFQPSVFSSNNLPSGSDSRAKGVSHMASYLPRYSR
jgi:hypothetical protein